MNQSRLDRINELAKISKERELSEEELTERKILRDEYIQIVRKNMRGTLDNTVIQYPDGSKEKLKKI